MPVKLTGMILAGAACLVLTEVSADGNYFGDMFFGLLLFGAGMGATFAAPQIAGLSGVAAQESGLAAALVGSSFRRRQRATHRRAPDRRRGAHDDVLANADSPASIAVANDREPSRRRSPRRLALQPSAR
jgi:hypothetical protein